MIFSKLMLIVIFLAAIGQVSAPIEADLAPISDPIAAVVLMFIAAFDPYITYKFLSLVGFDMYHAMTSEQEAKSALHRPVPVPSAPKADTAKKVLTRWHTASSTRSTGSPATEQLTTIRDMLSNLYDKSDVIFRGARSDRLHEPLVSAEVWYRAAHVHPPVR